jgi:hypothetical protein
MKSNVKSKSHPKTHEGAPARRIGAEAELRRSVMSCLLFEDEFYESGVAISDRIKGLIPEVEPGLVAAMAVEAREVFKLRHVPLLIAVTMCKYPEHKKLVGRVLENIIQRADELTEFLAIYWKDGKCPIAAQAKKGLAAAFRKFSAYDLAKYSRDGAVKLRDCLFMVHAKPVDKAQERLWKDLVDGKLATPDTWETELSSGKNKKDTWVRLISEGKLGALAMIRNLRNMTEAGVPREKVIEGLSSVKVDRVLPYRFIAAARYAPQYEPVLENCLFKCIEGMPKLPGHTIVLVDVSGSMSEKLSSKSELTRIDAACGLAMLAREMCESGRVFSFSEYLVEVPARRGFALRDAIKNSQSHSSTYLGRAVQELNKDKYDRIIVITDEQSHDAVCNPANKGYMVNTASNQHGVGYGAWTHLDGFSEGLLAYIAQAERAE